VKKELLVNGISVTRIVSKLEIYSDYWTNLKILVQDLVLDSFF